MTFDSSGFEARRAFDDIQQALEGYAGALSDATEHGDSAGRILVDNYRDQLNELARKFNRVTENTVPNFAH